MLILIMMMLEVKAEEEEKMEEEMNEARLSRHQMAESLSVRASAKIELVGRDATRRDATHRGINERSFDLGPAAAEILAGCVLQSFRRGWATSSAIHPPSAPSILLRPHFVATELWYFVCIWLQHVLITMAGICLDRLASSGAKIIHSYVRLLSRIAYPASPAVPLALMLAPSSLKHRASMHVPLRLTMAR